MREASLGEAAASWGTGMGRQTQSGPQTARDDKDVSRAVHAPCAAGVLHLSLPFIISDARV